MIIISYILLGIVSIAAGYIVLAASWYDVRAISRRAHLTRVIRTLHRSRQPSVAVLIDANISQQALVQCLRALAASHYYRFTISITTSRPSPEIKQLIQSYQQSHSALSLNYYVPRRFISHTHQLTQAYRRLPKHDFIFLLQTTDVVQSTTIKQVVARFIVDEHLGALQLSHRHTLSYSLTSLLVRYGEASRQLLQKAWPRFSRRTHTSIQTGTMFRHSYFMAHIHQTARRRRYDASLTITTQDGSFIRHPRAPLFTWPLSAAIAYCLLVAFIAAATLQSSALLVLSWVVTALWTLLALWSETTTRPMERISLSYGILVSPLLVFIQTAWLTVVLPINALIRLACQWYRAGRDTYRNRYQRHILDNILAFKTWYERMYPREVWYQDQRRADD